MMSEVMSINSMWFPKTFTKLEKKKNSILFNFEYKISFILNLNEMTMWCCVPGVI